MNNQSQERLFKMTALEACNDLYLKSVKPLLGRGNLSKGFARRLSVAYVKLKCEVIDNRVPREQREVLKDGTNKGTID